MHNCKDSMISYGKGQNKPIRKSVILEDANTKLDVIDYVVKDTQQDKTGINQRDGCYVRDVLKYALNFLFLMFFLAWNTPDFHVHYAKRCAIQTIWDMSGSNFYQLYLVFRGPKTPSEA